MGALDTWRQRVRRLKTDTYALYLAYRDPRVPWYARVVAACVVAYALSPIDLIPDFIPVLGYLDDLLLVPLGIALAIRLIPPEILADCRAQAQTSVDRGGAVGRAAALVVVALWLLGAVLAAMLLARHVG
jgi:uncharacterized membrane protein YkvA (DUF1232 family)